MDTSNLTIRNTGDGVPLTLKTITNGVPNGEPPLAVDSRRRVRNLNVDRVDFFHANELGRAAYDAIGDAADTNGALVQATVAAPKPGILIAGGSVAAFAPSVDNIRCRLPFDGNGNVP